MGGRCNKEGIGKYEEKNLGKNWREKITPVERDDIF